MTMKTLTFAKETIKFPTDPIYVKEYSDNTKMNYDLCKYLFMWSTLAEKYVTDKVYIKNFSKCMKTFDKDFSLEKYSNELEQMKRIKEKFSEEKKIYNKEHKDEIKKEKEEWKEKYGYALVDGEKVEVGNTLIESSRIFIGRGTNKYSGCIVEDVKEEDISINTSDKNFKLGNCKIEFKPETMSICTYTEHLMGTDVTFNKTIWFSNKSEFKANSDYEKFEHARLLKLHMNKINKSIKEMCLSENEKNRQIGCCAYLISRFGIRVGNPNDKGNGVVGASTLLIENIELWTDKRSIYLDFNGKDSIRYSNSLKVDEWVFEPMWKCMSENSLVRSGKEKLFTKITSQDLNDYFKSIVKGLEISPKWFRTYWGSSLLVDEIQKCNWENLTDKEFKNQYDSCCLSVTEKLNHKKTLTKEQNEKLNSSTKEKLNKAKINLKTTEDSISSKLEKLENDKRKAKVKFNGKLLKEKLNEISEKQNELKIKLENAKTKFKDLKEELKFKSETKDYAISTAKTNYSDCRVAFSLCKSFNKDPKIVYSKSLVERFEVWCNDVYNDYWKDYPNVKED